MFSSVTGLATLSSCLSRQYYFVNDPKSWTEAQSYCREHYTDLATVENQNDQNMLTSTIMTASSSLTWIGLYEDVQNSWKWYLDDAAFYGEGERDYRNWATGKPDNLGGNALCTKMQADGFWNDFSCNNNRNFACYDGKFHATYFTQKCNLPSLKLFLLLFLMMMMMMIINIAIYILCKLL